MADLEPLTKLIIYIEYKADFYLYDIVWKYIKELWEEASGSYNPEYTFKKMKKILSEIKDTDFIDYYKRLFLQFKKGCREEWVLIRYDNNQLKIETHKIVKEEDRKINRHLFDIIEIIEEENKIVVEYRYQENRTEKVIIEYVKSMDMYRIQESNYHIKSLYPEKEERGDVK